MRLGVIGIGYLGLTHAVCMADLGHEVIGLDVDADKVARVSKGDVPFFEPGLEPMLRKNLGADRLRFTTSFAEVAGFANVHFLYQWERHAAWRRGSGDKHRPGPKRTLRGIRNSSGKASPSKIALRQTASSSA